MKYEDFMESIGKIRKIISGNGVEIHNLIQAVLPHGMKITYATYTNAINGRNKKADHLEVIYPVCRAYADKLIAEAA